MPAGGDWLKADLRSAASALEKNTAPSEPARYRALLTRAVILSTLGEHREAVRATDLALDLTRFSPQIHLIRARVLARAGDVERASLAIEEGRKLQPNEPGLLELARSC